MPTELGRIEDTVSLRYAAVHNINGQSYAEFEPAPQQVRVSWPLLFYMFILSAERTEASRPWQKYYCKGYEI